MDTDNPRRRTGKVDRLPVEVRANVEQMLLSGVTYREIVEYLKEEGFSLSRMAVCTYAKRFLPLAQVLHVAQAVEKHRSQK